MTSLAAWAVFVAGLAVACGIFGAGGWVLRGQWDRFRAEVARDQARDEDMADAARERGGD